MTSTSQFELHPDAESLNAFVEHVLPEPERQQILSHLAGCSRCREITFLAQAAAEAEEPAAAPVPSVVGKQPWFANWRLATLAAAACVALATFTVLNLPKHPSTGNPGQVAKITPPEYRTAPPPPAPQASKPAGSQAVTPKPSEEKASRPPSKSPPQLSAQKIGPHAGSVKPERAAPNAEETGDGKLAKAGYEPQPPPIYAGSASQTVSVSPLSAALPTPQITETIRTQPAITMNSAQISKPLPSLTQASASPRPAPPDGSAFAKAAAGLSHRTAAPASHAAAAHTAAPDSASGSAPSSAANMHSVVSRSPDFADTLLARTALQARLPSGSTPVATAAAQRRVLAIDTGGSLFLSSDQGATWEPVAPQWTGRAVEVRVRPCPASCAETPASAAQGAADASPGAASPAQPARSAAQSATRSAPLFELVNDSGSVWTSPDGKTWKPN